MKNYIQIDGKQIEISEETAENLRKQFSKKETKSEDISIGYEMFCDIDWDKKEEVLIKDKLENRVFINQKFADNSEFGYNCVFIKCKFGSNCKFGSFCEFGSYCIKNTPYWDEEGKHK